MGSRAPVSAAGGLTRRALLVASPAALAACADTAAPARAYEGGWVGAAHERGHRLRSGSFPPPSVQRRAGVLVVGGGIAGLSALRALAAAGVDDAQLVELEDTAGGNSRGHAIAGMACPLGAHYLPTPGPQAREVAEWLQAIGLARHEHGRWVYEERHLCHAPQERLFFDGAWHEGLLPPGGAATQVQYRRFAQAVAQAQHDLGFAMPALRAPWTAGHAALDAQTFAAWLGAQGLDDPLLRAYLDYCCRDDYGAGIGVVSAWAGLHYFASRHGFHAPGGDEAAEPHDGVLTWPEGNAWLAQRLAAPLAGRVHAGRMAWRVDAGRHEVAVDVWDDSAQRSERWRARHVVLAVPLFVAARLCAAAPPGLAEAARRLRHAPWLVANLHLERPLLQRAGAPPAWDNVVHGSRMLGYVDAMHQATRPHAGPTVLTAYWALPESARPALLQRPWREWAGEVVAELAAVQPDLPSRVARVDLMRWGHAMAIPAPGVRGDAALAALRAGAGAQRVHVAHADLAGYSVFEEAFTHGALCAQRVTRRL